LFLAGIAAALCLAVTASGAVSTPGAASSGVDAGIVDVGIVAGYENGAAAGTGIVLSSSGVVLTNNHVIRGATSIRVTNVENGRTYSATVAGYDVSADIAVLRLKNASGLRTIPIADSSRVRVGQSVTAVGNAGGVGGTPAVTTGKVTALSRRITVGEEDGSTAELTGLIQIDAPLQPGDSGGPLLDGRGRVIGIDTAASTGFFFQSGTAEGFAIPINRALALAKQILAGHASRTVHIGPTAFLGVSVAFPSEYLAREERGAIVTDVVPGSPAERAGLRTGDVITSVDGRTISSPTALTTFLFAQAPGASVRLGWTDQVGGAQHASVRLASGPPH
jgi:S1-C subfamily serine protease